MKRRLCVRTGHRGVRQRGDGIGTPKRGFDIVASRDQPDTHHDGTLSKKAPNRCFVIRELVCSDVHSTSRTLVGPAVDTVGCEHFASSPREQRITKGRRQMMLAKGSFVQSRHGDDVVGCRFAIHHGATHDPQRCPRDAVPLGCHAVLLAATRIAHPAMLGDALWQ